MVCRGFQAPSIDVGLQSTPMLCLPFGWLKNSLYVMIVVRHPLERAKTFDVILRNQRNHPPATVKPTLQESPVRPTLIPAPIRSVRSIPLGATRSRNWLCVAQTGPMRAVW